jgi:cysteine desulfurase / selenocysteine lyase
VLFRSDFTLAPDAGRFEPGSLNSAGIYSLGASLDILREAGTKTIFARISELVDILADGLAQRGLFLLSSLERNERSGILVFTTRARDKVVYHELRQKGVIASLRGGGIRLSPHFYNNEEDAEAFFRALDESLKA